MRKPDNCSTRHSQQDLPCNCAFPGRQSNSRTQAHTKQRLTGVGGSDASSRSFCCAVLLCWTSPMLASIEAAATTPTNARKERRCEHAALVSCALRAKHQHKETSGKHTPRQAQGGATKRASAAAAAGNREPHRRCRGVSPSVRTGSAQRRPSSPPSLSQRRAGLCEEPPRWSGFETIIKKQKGSQTAASFRRGWEGVELNGEAGVSAR